MTLYSTKAPHITGARDPLNVAPNAALLIDFDNVTMGMRSDLSKELKTLLNSDIIKGKVTVQRAYADWRRYPQYIVPLSEASIDLIFAPAYGSNKKNATDIRMAIDGIELVFIRPEIGTFILLTGDSDFSSLVLKLKEYGKYVIGVGIQESSSDILVQNCDEYYSYTSLSGLRKTTDSDRQAIDPWVLVERAVEQMGQRDDVMRSDRLKQVMVELDPGFDEGEYGFSKFSRFLTEASSKGLLHIRKLDNGQYEVSPSGRRAGAATEERTEERPPREERSRGGRGGRGRRGERDEERRPAARVAEERPAERSAERPAETRDEGGRGPRHRERSEESTTPIVDGPPLRAAYDLLTRALERMLVDGRDAVRDSDVKRKMLELEEGFDEARLGFSKFSRFLNQALDHEVIELHKRESGNFEVSLRKGGAKREGSAVTTPAPRSEARPSTPSMPIQRAPATATSAPEPPESMLTSLGRRFGFLPPRSQPLATTPAAPPAPTPPSPAPRDEFASRPAAPMTPRAPTREPAPPQASAPMTTRPDAAPRRETPRRESPRGETSRRETPRRESPRREASGRDGTHGREDVPRTPARTAPVASEPPPRTTPSASEPARTAPSASEAPARGQERPAEQPRSDSRDDAATLGLPTGADDQVRYLSNAYKGVGKKTAEKLVEGFGEDVFNVLQKEPGRIQEVIPPARAETVLEQWKVDYDRRRSRLDDGSTSPPAEERRDPLSVGTASAQPAPTEPAPRPVVVATPVAPSTESIAAATPAPRVPAEPIAASVKPEANPAPVTPEPSSELDGLEPSRLRGRTSRGRRR